MALKLNIKPDIEQAMEALLATAGVRSKTEYINRAIAEYNRQLARQVDVAQVLEYFRDYDDEGKEMLREFANLRSSSH